MTPKKIDLGLVEAEVVKQMANDLSNEGLKGEISIVSGLDLDADNLTTKKGFTIKEIKSF